MIRLIVSKKLNSHECKHSTIVVASIKYPLHKLHVMWGFIDFNRTFGGFFGIDRYNLFAFDSTVAIPAVDIVIISITVNKLFVFLFSLFSFLFQLSIIFSYPVCSL